MKTSLLNNSLFICFLALFKGAFISQIVFEYKELIEAGSTAIYLAAYLISGHFTEADFQNWQNEFISIFAIIILSIYLKQIDL